MDKTNFRTKEKREFERFAQGDNQTVAARQ